MIGAPTDDQDPERGRIDEGQASRQSEVETCRPPKTHRRRSEAAPTDWTSLMTAARPEQQRMACRFEVSGLLSSREGSSAVSVRRRF